MRVHWRPQVQGEPRLAVEGAVELRDASLRLGVPITDLQGRLDLSYAEQADRPHPTMDLHIKADRLRAIDRLVESADLHLLTMETLPDALTIERLRGSIYGGVITGNGTLPLTPDEKFQVELTMQDAHFQPLLEPPAAPAAQSASAVAVSAENVAENSAENGAPTPVIAVSTDPSPTQQAPKRQPAKHQLAMDSEPGRTTARLTLEGVYGKPEALRGRGAVSVHHARLFDDSLALVLLQTANFSLPTANAFDRVSTEYIVDGRTVQFEEIRFEAPTFAIVGTGTMALPGCELALTFFSRNPSGGVLGPLSEMVNVFKDELVCVKVTGTLDKPKARLVSFEGMRDTWERLFKKPPPRVDAGDGGK